MELFGGLLNWIDIPNYIIDMVLYFYTPSFSGSADYVALLMRLQIITLLIAGGLYLVEHLMGGYGLYVMAKRAGIKHAWLGYLPFGSTYLAGQLAGETRIFSAKMKRAGLYAMLTELLLVLSSVAVLVMDFMMCRPEFYTPQFSDTTEDMLIGFTFAVPAQLQGMYVAMQVLTYFNQVVVFVVIFFFGVLFFALFRKYYPRSPLLMSFLTVLLPARGFVLFAVRNNAAVDYEAYVRKKTEEYRRASGYGAYGAQYDPRAKYDPQTGEPLRRDPHDNFDPQTGEPVRQEPPEPFSEFSDGKKTPTDSSEDDPFNDF